MKITRLYSILFILFLILAGCKNKSTRLEEVAAGVPLALAEYRNAHISNVRYNLGFEIPEDKEKTIPAKLILGFQLNTLESPLYIDFKEESQKLKSINVNGKEIPVVHKNEHISVATKYLLEGDNSITIDFMAGELSLNRNKEFLYTLLVPDRARTLFPCFDQPNLKGIYSLNITAPTDWEVLCGAPEVSKKETGNYTSHQFAPSDKMSTYLFSFVAGKFQSITHNPDTFPMKMLYRETNADKIVFSTDSIFGLHQQALSFLEDYTNYPFPFQKFDFATIPGFQYGGMEHVGAIQYREGALFLDESATQNQLLGRAKLIAHETAHMWFGDLVTMDWFNDVWMKEVFANFMADKIVNPAFPEINHDLSFMVTHYPRAYGEDRTSGTNPIRQNLENLDNAGSLYGSIIYNKAPIMMRQLESVIGKEAFKEGIQEYIKTYANGNAVWNDLIQILDKKSNLDLNAWSDVWVNNSSRPIFEESITYNKKRDINSFIISQTAEDGSAQIWPQTFDIALVYEDTIKSITVDMKDKTQKITKAIGMETPLAIHYNSKGAGYGVFPLKPENLQTLSTIENEVTRGYGYINAYENTLIGGISPTALLNVLRTSFASEKNILLANLLSSYTRSIFWKYLTNEQRAIYQQLISNELWKQLNSDLSPNIKKIIFSTFSSLAYSDTSSNQLYNIWNKDIQIPNLKLNEDDYTEMALTLSLYGHGRSKAILATAKEAISNPDKLERFEFLLPSVSDDTEIKAQFFESLKLEKNRAKEAWVISAMNNLNHPLHQKESIHYLKSSLDLLGEIQKTGDIFFPKRWLSSTIGNYTSQEAFKILETFLTDNKDLNPSLKKKLLQASDDLRRVQLLNKKIDKSVD